MVLGEQIRQCRLARGLSQEQLAEQMDVSRQAVTKWESGRSAPSTENLLRLAELFGQPLAPLAEAAPSEPPPRSRRGLVRPKAALLVLLAFAAVYLLGRVFCTTADNLSLLGWLFGTDPCQTTYLFGWLVEQHLFLISGVIVVLPALFGRLRFSAVTLGGFALGLLLGELLGPVRTPQPFRPDHWGWLIWGLIFLASMAVGALLQKLKKT